MDNSCNRDLDQKMVEIMNIQKAAVQQLTTDYCVESPFNIGSSVVRAMDFCVDIDDDDLFPPEDLNFIKKQRSGSKLLSQRSGGFDNTRKSNPGNFLQGEKLLQM